MPLSFTTLCQPTVLKLCKIPNSKNILYQKASLSPPPQSISKEAWQVQREDAHQRSIGMEKLVADEE